jgi:hypothetical protein
MLPTVMTAKRNLIAALAAATLALPAAPALAWGKKEQGFVAGVVTTIIVDELFTQGRIAREARRSPEVIYVERPTYGTGSGSGSGTTSIYRTPAAKAFQSYSLHERKAIQRNLRAWGYYRGGIDGSFGPGTYNAITAYARDEGVSLGSTGNAFGVYDSLIF